MQTWPIQQQNPYYMAFRNLATPQDNRRSVGSRSVPHLLVANKYRRPDSLRCSSLVNRYEGCGPTAGRGERSKPPLTLVAGSRPTGRGEATDYTASLNLKVKVLDFVQLGGPIWTVGSTIFEMWL